MTLPDADADVGENENSRLVPSALSLLPFAMYASMVQRGCLQRNRNPVRIGARKRDLHERIL